MLCFNVASLCEQEFGFIVCPILILLNDTWIDAGMNTNARNAQGMHMMQGMHINAGMNHGMHISAGNALDTALMYCVINKIRIGHTMRECAPVPSSSCCRRIASHRSLSAAPEVRCTRSFASIAPIVLGNNDTNAHQWQECAVAKEMHSNDRNAHQQLIAQQ